MSASDSLEVEAALETERQLVLTLGGYALEVAGATLVTHERLPVPRFNFVQELGVGAERQSAFFERALDHYFQRALRPTFRVPLPVPPHLDAGLRRFGFRPLPSPLELMLSASHAKLAPSASRRVRAAQPSEIDTVASFWTSDRERPEFRAALDVAWNHPNPNEELVPVLAFDADEAVSAALLYRYRTTAGIYAVATRPAARGRGAASDLVRFATAADLVRGSRSYSIFADSPRLEQRLVTLGFRTVRSFREYALPPDAQLALPDPGPTGPPRWRPPR